MCFLGKIDSSQHEYDISVVLWCWGSFHVLFSFPISDLSDIDFLEDSTTESLLFSGDEYNQDLDSITMEDFQDEDEVGADEIVRCICEMDEENGFMIQVGLLLAMALLELWKRFSFCL